MPRTKIVNPESMRAPLDAQIAGIEYNRQAIQTRLRMREKYESNGEVQRNRMMTKEERVRNAIELQTKNIKEFNDFKAGRDTTMAAAEKKAREIASRALGEKV